MREGDSLVIWEGPIGHRVQFGSETLAILQEDKLLQDERKFHDAKDEKGVYVIFSYGEDLSPYEYLRRTFRSWRSKAAEPLGIVIYENCYSRDIGEQFGVTV